MTNIKQLEEQILRHKQLYYYGTPEISDAEYDKLEENLRTLSPDSPVLSFVGHKITGDRIKHEQPMLSLEKVKSVKAFDKWASNESVTVSDKVDGSACSMVYENGLFKYAKTRGDGTYGEDITRSVSYMDFPRTLDTKDISEVRGEICITKANFEKLKLEMYKRGLPEPESIRNCVAGLLHRKTHADLCCYLTFLAYGISTNDTWYLKNNYEYALFIQLEDLGFNVPKYIHFAFSDCVESFLEKGPQDREYLTDGYVFAIDNLKDQLDRGFTSHHPKGKIAFKFASETDETEIKDILIDVGRTGKLSFVAEVVPVHLSGATISRLTLHNWKYIQDHTLGKNAIIEITRSNEVIPKHVRTVRSPGILKRPEECPVCGSQLVLSETRIDLYCSSDKCPAKAYGRLENWVKIVEIDNVGDETLKDLFETGKVSTVADFYRLTPDDLEELPRMGKRSARKIYNNIQKTKDVPFDKFLAALGIDGLGRSIARIIGERFLSLDKLYEELKAPIPGLCLSSIDGIGLILSGNIVEGMRSYGFQTAQELAQVGVTVEDLPNPAECTLKGVAFAITGSLGKPRKVLTDMIKAKGGKVSSSVSSKTNYLVCNEISGSSKCRKAKELGIEIISEGKLLEMLDK